MGMLPRDHPLCTTILDLTALQGLAPEGVDLPPVEGIQLSIQQQHCIKMNWTAALASILVASLGWTTVSIISNYIAARKIGLPLVISPVYPLNPFWIITYRVFPVIFLLKYLPFGLGTWARCTYLGWQFHEKHALHDELGPVFLIVTPGGNEVAVADAQVAHAILSHGKEFIKPVFMYGT